MAVRREYRGFRPDCAVRFWRRECRDL